MSLDQNRKINGVISALPTPFINGEVDFASLEKLVQFQIDNGIDGFVVNGTTAESPTLTKDEVKKIYQVVKSKAKNDKIVILGTGSNSTKDTIENTKLAAELKADAALVVVPYYNKPPQRGLVEHFKSIANAVTVPIILYNVPGRTITALSLGSIVELSKIKNISTIKEASGDIGFAKELKSALPADFQLLSGDDGTYIEFLKAGGQGIISVMSNVIPKACADWTAGVKLGKVADVEKDFNRYKNFINSMYIEANPIPVKWMLYRMGLFKSAEMRLPLVAIEKSLEEKVQAEMKSVGLA